jgi:hypothetical protein
LFTTFQHVVAHFGYHRRGHAAQASEALRHHVRSTLPIEVLALGKRANKLLGHVLLCCGLEYACRALRVVVAQKVHPGGTKIGVDKLHLAVVNEGFQCLLVAPFSDAIIFRLTDQRNIQLGAFRSR